jgi:Flp pilus assembly pilin Flp
MTDFSSPTALFHLCSGLLSLTRFDRHRLALRAGIDGSHRFAAKARALRVDLRGVTVVEYAVVIGALGLAIAAGFATLSLKLMEKVEVLPL